MAGPSVGRLAAGDQPIVRVLADRLEHPVAGGVGVLDDDERAIDEATQAVQRLDARHPGRRRRGIVLVADHAGRRLQRPATREHRQSAEQPLVRLGQEVPAPVDERLEGLLAGDGGPTTAGQEAETVAQALARSPRRTCTLARAAASSRASGMPSSRRQISTTLAAFESSSRNEGSVVVARSTNRLTASVAAIASRSTWSEVVGQGERRHRVGRLAGDAERFAARREHVQRPAAREEVLDQAVRLPR